MLDRVKISLHIEQRYLAHGGKEMTRPLASNQQRRIIEFLKEPTSYEPPVDRVEIIETHISLVFLAGDQVYKLKRSFKYPYLDFSTESNCHRACEAELALNKRTAPALYLEVRPIAEGADGTIGWGEEGTILDWVVIMRRFDQALLFDSLAMRGSLSPRLLLDLVDHVAAFHAQAERRLDRGGVAAVAAIEEANAEALHKAGARFFSTQEIGTLHSRSLETVARLSGLLEARRAAGKVRHCHGDLYLRNICLLDEKPVLFDCLEFSEELASIDVLYDVAFLLMDLDHRGLQDLANLAANRYLDMTDEGDGIAAMPLFLSMRAAIRAHVTATAANCASASEDLMSEARGYFDFALGALCPKPPRLIAIGGLSGTGKSTIAQKLAPNLGIRPGARVLRSDVIRKRLCDVKPEVPLPPAAYQSEMSQRVYQTIREKATTALRAGYCAIIDAVSLTEDERRSFAAVAEEVRVPFSGIWLEASPKIMAARLGSRRNDASDASVEVLQQQLQRDPGPIDWLRVDVRGDRASTVEAVRCALRVD